MQLEENVTAAGGIVHWARDAAEANAIVADLVRAHGTSEVVKVKSMTTQEIELNEALAKAGIDAWETDLAELIVQLGHDLPSHILVPAIHRNRVRDPGHLRGGDEGRGRPAPPGPERTTPQSLPKRRASTCARSSCGRRSAISGGNFAHRGNRDRDGGRVGGATAACA